MSQTMPGLRQRRNATSRAPVILSIFAEVLRGCSSTFGTAPLRLGTRHPTLAATRYAHIPHMYACAVFKNHRYSTSCPDLYLHCLPLSVSMAKSPSSRKAERLNFPTRLVHTNST